MQCCLLIIADQLLSISKFFVRILTYSWIRNILNSQSAMYDALSLVLESKGNPPQSVSAQSESTAASTAPSISTSVLLSMSRTFLAAVANSIQQVLSAQQVVSLPTTSLPTSVANSVGVSAPPANSSHLATQASSLAASVWCCPYLCGHLFHSYSASPSTLNVALPLSTIGGASLASLAVIQFYGL